MKLKNAIKFAKKLKVYLPREDQWFEARFKSFTRNHIRVVFNDLTSMKIPKKNWNIKTKKQISFRIIYKRKSITAKQELELLYANDQIRCNICKSKLQKHNRIRDHITPLQAGGSNDLQNIQIICNICSTLKTQVFDQRHLSMS